MSLSACLNRSGYVRDQQCISVRVVRQLFPSHCCGDPTTSTYPWSLVMWFSFSISVIVTSLLSVLSRLLLVFLTLRTFRSVVVNCIWTSTSAIVNAPFVLTRATINYSIIPKTKDSPKVFSLIKRILSRSGTELLEYFRLTRPNALNSTADGERLVPLMDHIEYHLQNSPTTVNNPLQRQRH